MRRVAVSQRVDYYPERRERRDALDQNMVVWLRAADYMPFPIPNPFLFESDVCEWLDALQPVGLVLSGGNDIGKEPRRDFTEGIMLEYALQHRLPVLGICRGMQMLGNWAMTGLTSVSGHIGKSHELKGKISGPANSYHSFALDSCPAGFRVLARSEDDSIEAIGHKELPWEGWMWHPEREPEFLSRDIERLKALFT